MYNFKDQEKLEKEYFENKEEYKKCSNCSGQYFNEISFEIFECCDCGEIVNE